MNTHHAFEAARRFDLFDVNEPFAFAAEMRERAFAADPTSRTIFTMVGLRHDNYIVVLAEGERHVIEAAFGDEGEPATDDESSDALAALANLTALPILFVVAPIDTPAPSSVPKLDVTTLPGHQRILTSARAAADARKAKEAN